MKQKELAKKLNISESYVSDIISRKRRPSYGLGKRIAGVLGTDVLFIMEGPADEIRKVVRSA